MIYDQDLGAPDATGRFIQEGDRIVVGSNSGIRVGKVIAVKGFEHVKRNGPVYGYSYSVTAMLEFPSEKRQTFPHETMGHEKFLVIT